MHKICLVGGEDSHKRIELSQYLIKAGFDVTIAGTGSQEFPDNITYVKYSLNRAIAPLDDYKTIKWYRKFFTENQFDLIQTFDTKPAFLVPLALKNTTTPITRTITGVGKIFTNSGILYYFLRKLYFMLHKRCKQRVNKTIFQNTDDLKLFLKNKLVKEEKTSLILSSGIELSQYTKTAKRDSKPFTFICVSRLVYTKGITHLIEAAKVCKEKGYNFNVLLVGPLEENTKKFNENSLTDNSDVVEWLGQRSDVDELLLKAHSFILPTFGGEGLPRVLLEAAATGLTIISTNVTGVRGFLKDEYDALLIQAKDSTALANAMVRIYEDSTLSQKLVENALKTVKLYSLERVSNQYITIFNAEIENANS